MSAVSCANISLPPSPTKMPIFNRTRSLRRSKRKTKLKKADISQPMNFYHCYHAEYDVNTDGFSGLPPQWKTLVDTEAKRVSKSTGNTPEPTKKPAPIVRGSDSCLEETVKYVQEHYHSLTGDDEELEQFIDIQLRSQSGSQNSSQNGSQQQLVSTYSPSTTNTPTIPPLTTRSSTLSGHPPSPFSFTAPLDAIQSDLGLYDSEGSSVLTTSSHIIYSPSESSGYFGSTMSSLYSSRLSTSQHISSSSSSAHPQCRSPSHQTLGPIRSYQPFETSHDHLTSQEPMGSQHRFSSLQRPSRNNSPSHTNPHKLKRYDPQTTTSSQLHSTRIQPHDISHVSSIITTTTTTCTTGKSHTPLTATSAGTIPCKPPRTSRLRDRGKMSAEHFRTTMQLLVNPGDPRDDLDGFVKVGEGSTGIVYTAHQLSTNEVVAVKKMNLWNQQRKELLFNEVCICHQLHYV